MPVSLPELAFAALLTMCAAAVQGSIGMGFNIVTVPVLALVNPILVPVPQMLLQLGLTAFMGARERAHVDLKGVGWILIGRLPGAVIGIALLKMLTGRSLDAIIALFVLGAVVVSTAGWTVQRTRGTQIAAGVISGTTGLVSSIGGPPIALLYRDADGPTVRSSLATVFLFGTMISLLGRFGANEMAWTDVTVAAWLIPAAAIGVWASKFVARRAEGIVIRQGILVLSSAAAVALLVRSIVG